jgi:hypothetical protein
MPGSPTNFRERKPAQSAFRGSPKNVASNIRTLDLCYPALGGAKGLHYGPHCVGRYDDRGLPFPPSNTPASKPGKQSERKVGSV